MQLNYYAGKEAASMATTRIISMHINQGKTIADCLTDRIDYSKNPDKTRKPPTRSFFTPSGSTRPSPGGSSGTT